jgi:cell division protease FtsH
VDLRKIAAITPGFAGADLANLVNEAALLAARRNHEQVTVTDFQEAVDRIIGGLEKKNRAMNPKEKEIVAYHESGHALVAMNLKNVDPVNKISIIPRGIGALGYTQQRPTEDRYLMTHEELLNRLRVLLGGRVAEEIIFGDVSTGAQNDLQRATDIVRSMVMEYGMSEQLGLLTYGRQQRPTYLEAPGASRDREFSEKIAEEIDTEMARILDGAHQDVRRILKEERGQLEKLAAILLDKEVIEGKELQEFVREIKARQVESS